MMHTFLTQDVSLRDVQEVFVGDVSKSLVKCYNERDAKNVSQRDVFVFAVVCRPSSKLKSTITDLLIIALSHRGLV